MTPKKVFLFLVCFIIISLVVVYNSNSDHLEDRGFFPTCQYIGSRATEGTPQNDADYIFDKCDCIADVVEKEEIDHQGMQVDLVVSVFTNSDYFPKREGIDAQHQFDMIGIAEQSCN